VQAIDAGITNDTRSCRDMYQENTRRVRLKENAEVVHSLQAALRAHASDVAAARRLTQVRATASLCRADAWAVWVVSRAPAELWLTQRAEKVEALSEEIANLRTKLSRAEEAAQVPFLLLCDPHGDVLPTRVPPVPPPRPAPWRMCVCGLDHHWPWWCGVGGNDGNTPQAAALDKVEHAARGTELGRWQRAVAVLGAAGSTGQAAAGAPPTPRKMAPAAAGAAIQSLQAENSWRGGEIARLRSLGEESAARAKKLAAEVVALKKEVQARSRSVQVKQQPESRPAPPRSIRPPLSPQLNGFWVVGAGEGGAGGEAAARPGLPSIAEGGAAAAGGQLCRHARR
jgi:hypothetical protein